MNSIGVDVSKYNISGSSIWNPDTAKKPIDYVIQRASYGGSLGGQVKDELFDKMYEQVQKVPIRGAYHYYSSHSNWKVQADFFLNIVRSKDFHFYAVDYETAYNTLDKRTTAEFIEMVKYIKEQTGKKCLIYFNWNVYNVYLASQASWVNTQDIWYAWYPYQTVETPPTAVRLPIGVHTWRFNQYGAGDVAGTAGVVAGANYGGGTRGIDLNQYNGNVSDLRNWIGMTVQPEEPTLTDSEKLAKLWQIHPELH